MVSIVVVYNNKQSLDEILLPSLKNQTSEFELIPIDNTKGQFKSAAEALNYGGAKAKGKYIMFVHQDVDLCSNTWLGDTEKILDSIPNLGIAGVAGVSEIGRRNEERGRNIIEHMEDHRVWDWGHTIKEPERVQTLDECLVIIPKSVFSELQFDEKTCNDFHLYGVDYCLSSKRLGFHVYAIPMFIYHKSGGFFPKKSIVQILKSRGSLPTPYYQTLGKLIKKHKNHYKRIYTTCGYWSTSQPVTLQKIKHLANSGLELLLGKLRRGWQK